MREVHDVALLIGYGAAAVNPYLALDSWRARRRGRVPGTRGRSRTLHPRARGRSAQGDVQDGHLDGAELPRRADLRGGRPRPRPDGPALHGHAVAHRRHRARRARSTRRSCGTTRGFGASPTIVDELPVGGQYQLAAHAASSHKWNPATIAALQARGAHERPARSSTSSSACATTKTNALVTLRGLLDVEGGDPIPLDEVEPVSAIVSSGS